MNKDAKWKKASAGVVIHTPSEADATVRILIQTRRARRKNVSGFLKVLTRSPRYAFQTLRCRSTFFASAELILCTYLDPKLFLFLILFISVPIVTYSGTTAKNLIVFFRSDCPPCIEEIRIIPAIARQHANLAIRIISLSGDISGKYFRSGQPENVSVSVAGEEERKMLQNLGDRELVLPFSVLMDGQGKVCARHKGIIGTDRISEWLKAC